MEPTITINLTEKELNIVATGLAELPFKLVNDIMVKIGKQVNAQIKTDKPSDSL